MIVSTIPVCSGLLVSSERDTYNTNLRLDHQLNEECAGESVITWNPSDEVDLVLRVSHGVYGSPMISRMQSPPKAWPHESRIRFRRFGTAKTARATRGFSNIQQVADPYNDPWISAAALASTSPVANVGFYETRMKASNLLMTSSFWFQSVHTETDVTETIGNTTNFRSHYMPINTHYVRTRLSPFSEKVLLASDSRLI